MNIQGAKGKGTEEEQGWELGTLIVNVREELWNAVKSRAAHAYNLRHAPFAQPRAKNDALSRLHGYPSICFVTDGLQVNSLDPNGDWVRDKAGPGAIAISGVRDSGDVAYEIVNFIDGIRSVGEIRDAVSAEYEPVPLAAVAEYLDRLARAGAVSFRR